jgi:hypothetical protein
MNGTEVDGETLDVEEAHGNLSFVAPVPDIAAGCVVGSVSPA